MQPASKRRRTESTAQVNLAEYIFTRLKQIGVDSIHGLPGDYNLKALDFVAPSGLDWVGSCNELNAGYAADGYARTKGVGALVVTFGVGELSAINAIAGSFAERVPVVLVVGAPVRPFIRDRKYVHHTLGNGDYDAFARMAKEVTVAQALLRETKEAPGLIDDALRECVKQSRPVYIQLPEDMGYTMVSKSLLSTRIDLSFPANDKSKEDTVIAKLLERIYSAKQPFIIVDGETSRNGYVEEAKRFAKETGFPTATTPFGKGILDESLPNFHGVYNGTVGKLNYDSFVKESDLVIRFGPNECSINTVAFNTIPSRDVALDFHDHAIEMKELESGHVDGLYVKYLLKNLLDKLDLSKIHKYDPYPIEASQKNLLDELPKVDDKASIDQATFFLRISSFFRPGDVILTETGTSSVGCREFVLPPDTTIINSTTWLSIGFMCPAAQGVALAHRDMAASGQETRVRRTLLFQGDGSFQLTGQELSTVIKKKLDLTFFLINNDGYTIERYLHGMKATYNDIARWDYLNAPKLFGAPDDGSYHVYTRKATTWGELNAVLADKAFSDEPGLKMVEVIMDREDCPESLKKVAKAQEESRLAQQG